MYQYQFSNKQNLKIQNKSKICFKRKWWRKNPSKLFSVMSIKGRSGSLGSGKGMGAELAEGSFPWEITQKSNAGKSQSQSSEDSGEGQQKWAVQGGCAEVHSHQLGGRRLLLGQGPCQGSHRSQSPDPCCDLDTPAAERPQTRLLHSGERREHHWPHWQGEHVLGNVWCCGPKLPSLPGFGVDPPQMAALPIHPAAAQPSISWDYSEMGEKLYGRLWEPEMSL